MLAEIGRRLAGDRGLGHLVELDDLALGHVPVVRVGDLDAHQREIGVVDATGEPGLGQLRPELLLFRPVCVSLRNRLCGVALLRLRVIPRQP